MQSPSQMFFPVNLEWTWHAGQDRVAAVASWGSLGGCCKLFAMRQLLRFSWENVDPRNPVDGSELRRSPLEVRCLSHYLESPDCLWNRCWFQRFVGIFTLQKGSNLVCAYFSKARTKNTIIYKMTSPKEMEQKSTVPWIMGSLTVASARWFEIYSPAT